eukprot:8479001-Ditylum_brightwellii.AAC.1
MKQCLNTKSSTKTELIGVNNAMPHVLWTSYSLWGQGYKVNAAKIYQDNLSAMLLKKNGKWSNRISNGEIKVDHCGTEDMVADFFIKPLQGTLLRQFRALILNLIEE